MTHTTASGVPIPSGTDAFNPPAQFKTWADFAARYDFYTVVPLDTDRTALAEPVLRDGLVCYVTGTGTEWRYANGSWTVTQHDTGWITATPGANWGGATPISPVRYRRLNGVVYLRGIVSRTAGSDNIFTLPAGFWPAVNAVHPIATTASANDVRITVSTAGVVSQVPLAAGQFMFLDGMAPFIAEQ